MCKKKKITISSFMAVFMKYIKYCQFTNVYGITVFCYPPVYKTRLLVQLSGDVSDFCPWYLLHES